MPFASAFFYIFLMLFHSLLLWIFALRPTAQIAAGALCKVQVHLVERQLGHFGVGESLLWSDTQGVLRAAHNILAVFWKPCLTLKGSFPPMILNHPTSIPPAFPWQSTCHSTHSQISPGLWSHQLSPLTGPALALGLSPQGRLVPPLPTPGFRKFNINSADLLGSKDKGCFKALFCSFFIGYSTRLSFALC